MLTGEAFRHVDQRGLDRAIAVGAVGHCGGDGGDDDEGGIARLCSGGCEQRLGGIEGVDGGEHVELEVLFPRVDVIALRHGARVRDEDVEAAEFAGSRGNPAFQGGPVRDVH